MIKYVKNKISGQYLFTGNDAQSDSAMLANALSIEGINEADVEIGLISEEDYLLATEAWIESKKTYDKKRLETYPLLREFAEAYTEKEIGGNSTKWDAYVINYNKVRTENPK